MMGFWLSSSKTQNFLVLGAGGSDWIMETEREGGLIAPRAEGGDLVPMLGELGFWVAGSMRSK